MRDPHNIDPKYWTHDVIGGLKIRRPGDVIRVRAQLIDYIFKTSTLPATLPTTVTPVPSPTAFVVPGLARCEALMMTLPAGFEAVAYHFVPANPHGDLMVLHQGHAAGYSLGMDKVLLSLLTSGVGVVTCWMPLYPPNNAPPGFGLDHNAVLFAALETPALAPIRLFVEPVIAAINYVAPSYSAVHMAGLSGGGWTTTLCAAIDPRIRLSIPIAGSLPMYLRDGPGEEPAKGDPHYDYEQFCPAVFRFAEYLDLYVLGSVGHGREQIQCLNQFDDTCFDGLRYRTYESLLRHHVAALGGRFSVFLNSGTNPNSPKFHHAIGDLVREGVVLRRLRRDPIFVVDNGGRGFSSAGSWTEQIGAGFQRDVTVASAETDSSTARARWRCDDASAGWWRVSVTWTPSPSRSAAARYFVIQDDTVHLTVDVNQTIAPAGRTDLETPWTDLGIVRLTGSSVRIELETNPHGEVCADAVRIERVEDPMPFPTGTWDVVANGLSGSMTVAVSPTGAVTGAMFGDMITGFWDDVSKKLEVVRAPITDVKRQQVYTGYLFAEAGSNSVLAGSFTSFGLAGAGPGRTTFGWYARKV